MKKYVVFLYLQNLYSGLYEYEDIILNDDNYYDDEDDNYIIVVDDYNRTHKINKIFIDFLTTDEITEKLNSYKLSKK